MMALRNNHSTVAYREVQRVTQLWIWAIVLVMAALGWWGFVQQVVLGTPLGNEPAPDWVLVVIWLVAGLGLPLFVLMVNLRTEVRDDAIRLRYFPLWSKTIRIADIRECQPRTYRPLGEYWGWGIRWAPGHGWAYNVKGNRGVQLVLGDGKRLLIGSGRAEELAEAINARRTP